jgi:inorganic pyrophosphatase
MHAALDLLTFRPRESNSELVNVIVETTKGSRNKFVYDGERGLFRLKKVLPYGAVFPFDFGFIPSTRGDDGDPLDVLLLMDEPTFPGCLVPARLIGVIEARQTSRKGKRERNDRLIAVAGECQRFAGLESFKDMDTRDIEEIEHFFISYNEQAGKKFTPLGRGGPKTAEKLLEEGMRQFQKKRGHSAA